MLQSGRATRNSFRWSRYDEAVATTLSNAQGGLCFGLDGKLRLSSKNKAQDGIVPAAAPPRVQMRGASEDQASHVA